MLLASRLRIFSSIGKALHVSSRVLNNEDSVKRAIETGDVSSFPERFNFTRDVVDLWAKHESPLRKSVPALWMIQDGRSKTYTYRELSQISKRIAGVFHNYGIKKGDRILLCLPKCPEYWFIMLGLVRCGIEFTSITTQATGYDLRYRIERFTPKMVISNKISDVDFATVNTEVEYKMSISYEGVGWMSLTSLMESAGDFDGYNTSLNDPAIVFFTSGTTGKPKMVEHTHSYLLAHVITGKRLYFLKHTDVFWCLADTGWAKVAYATFSTWLYRACAFVDTSARFSPYDVLKVLQDYPITKFCAPPTVYRQLINKESGLFNFKALNDCVSAGEPLNPEALHAWKALTNIYIREGYGQTETIVVACAPYGSVVKPGSMGLPLKECQVVILNDDLSPVKQGEVGQLALSMSPVKPIGLLKGYRDAEDKNADAFKNGYYLTGDKVYQDEDGYLWFVSRADDIIISAGYRIGPFEIESVLLEHPAVVESAVVGVSDPDRFEIVKAFIVLAENYTSYDHDKLANEIQEFVKQRTAPYKYPRQIEFVNSLPKTMSGKIQRNILRQKK
ncbi:acyl-coenzyme A synthetase ACSM3, mitochondrial-like [Varroa jacobsoni]|uniref:medium-chain acyl-CoA ligase n=1 Tax=Varroa destructor TaxID=109461 RepID=A0A7M7K2L7_VARDE|nr:acyl-coenzyme A synthetase ACSM3, mitochondrial-like [Varroa destructor]XP_022686587.1 acyl-coenzyme A synthetase ACSM3, mitochondrial-like [Varroa jacobsoni]